MSATKNISINRDDKNKIEIIFSTVIFIKAIITIVGTLILGLMVFTIPRLRKEYILYIFTYIGVIGNSIFPVWFFQGMEEMKYIDYYMILNIEAMWIFLRY